MAAQSLMFILFCSRKMPHKKQWSLFKKCCNPQEDVQLLQAAGV